MAPSAQIYKAIAVNEEEEEEGDSERAREGGREGERERERETMNEEDSERPNYALLTFAEAGLLAAPTATRATGRDPNKKRGQKQKEKQHCSHALISSVRGRAEFAPTQSAHMCCNYTP